MSIATKMQSWFTALQGLVTSANNATGASDTNISDAVARLIDGYGSGGGGLSYADELYSIDSKSITYTSTTAGTALTVSGLSGVYNYPFILVIVENNDTSAEASKFIRSADVIGNIKFGQNAASVVRYGTMHYYNASAALTNYSGTSYGLWGYSIGASSVTIRGRCNGTYFTTLTGNYKIRILGIKL